MAEHRSPRHNYPPLTFRTPVPTSDTGANRVPKPRYKRKRTRSDDVNSDARQKRVRYFQSYYQTACRGARPRYFSESTYYRRDKEDRHNVSSAPALHYRGPGYRQNLFHQTPASLDYNYLHPPHHRPPPHSHPHRHDLLHHRHRHQHQLPTLQQRDSFFGDPFDYSPDTGTAGAVLPTSLPHNQPPQTPVPLHSSNTMDTGSHVLRYDATHRYAIAENFIRSVAGTYKMMNRAEDRKRILSNQLPSSIKSKSIANSFIFCTSSDGDAFETEIASMRRHQKHIMDFTRLDRAIQRVTCRIRKRPIAPGLTARQLSIVRAVRIIAIAFNRINYVSRIKHYCDKDSRFSNYLRDQLTKRCSEGSRLNIGIRRFISSVNVEKHRDICLVFVGMLCQTPHMWARSIRLLNRLKIFYQHVLLKLFCDENIDLKDIFEPPYHSTAHKILTQARQVIPAFVLNDPVNTVMNMMKQKQQTAVTAASSASTQLVSDLTDAMRTPDPQDAPLSPPLLHAELSQRLSPEIPTRDCFASFSSPLPPPPRTPSFRPDDTEDFIFYPNPPSSEQLSEDSSISNAGSPTREQTIVDPDNDVRATENTHSDSSTVSRSSCKTPIYDSESSSESSTDSTTRSHESCPKTTPETAAIARSKSSCTCTSSSSSTSPSSSSSEDGSKRSHGSQASQTSSFRRPSNSTSSDSSETVDLQKSDRDSDDGSAATPFPPPLVSATSQTFASPNLPSLFRSSPLKLSSEDDANTARHSSPNGSVFGDTFTSAHLLSPTEIFSDHLTFNGDDRQNSPNYWTANPTKNFISVHVGHSASSSTSSESTSPPQILSSTPQDYTDIITIETSR